MDTKAVDNKKRGIIVGVVVIALVCGLGGWQYVKTAQKLKHTETLLAQTTSEAQLSKIEFEGLLAQAEQKNDELSSELDEQREKVEDFEKEIKGITKTVGTLEKLSKTDKELLQKYSKIYFLNEHYNPADLDEIDSKFLETPTQKEYIHFEVWPHLEDLLEDAYDDDIDLTVVSAYRSFGEQTSLKTQYKVVYGAGTANQFSADQGYSEHQLGTAVDFDVKENNGAFEKFETTPTYAWLLKNAYKYGFVISYPQGNAYYQFEPWHWRFVGKDLARDLHDDKKFFYDMDQRDIDKYLVSIFD